MAIDTSCDNGSLITRNLSAADFVDRSCIIYGASGSGKTTAIKHIMYILRDHCPNVLVFSASDKDNGLYSRNLVPPQLVYDHISTDVLDELATRQSKSRQIYDQARTMHILQSLFSRVATREQKDILRKISEIYNEFIARDPSAGESLRDISEEKQREIMLRVIRGSRNSDTLGSRANLSLEEKFSMRWLDFNPRILVVFDDCTSDFKSIQNNPTILDQIFRGRHFLCTSIIALHGPSSVMPIMRTNAYNSIFTDSVSAMSFADAPTNGLSRIKKKEFERYSAQILTDRAPYTKLIYHANNCALCSFENRAGFVAVSDPVARFCTKCARDDKKELKDWMQRLI